MREQNFDLLLEKLNAFKKKYYTNQLLKGLIYFVGIGVLTFLGVIGLEYFLYLKYPAKPILFCGFVLIELAILWRYIISPVLKLNSIGKTINDFDAANIIGKHFPEVKDKITNTLQLKAIIDKEGSDFSLLIASIEQKIIELKPVPFSMAIDFKANKKYLKYAVAPLFLLFVLSFTSPSLIKDGTARFMNYDVEYQKPLPFNFVVENEDLTASKNEDFELVVSTTGELQPNEVFVKVGENSFKMRKQNGSRFAFTLKNIQKSTDFQLYSNPVTSSTYTLEVMPTPIVKGLKVSLDYPSYTQKPDEELNSSGDLLIPEGTNILWGFTVEDVDDVLIIAADSIKAKQTQSNLFEAQYLPKTNSQYSVLAKNATNNKIEALNYTITLIKDQYPTISVQELKDSIGLSQIYFNGDINDDYGVSSLVFHATKNDSSIKLNVPLRSGLANQNFYYSWSLSELNLKAGDEVTYYFEVFDNDAVNGSKSTKSQIKQLKLPTIDELNKMNQAQNEAIKSSMNEAIEEVKELQKEVEDLTKKLLEKKKPSWEEKEQLKQLLDKRNQLENKVEDLINKNKEKNQMRNELVSPSPELLEKQKKLEELLENIMDDEMKKMLEEMEKLMEQMDKNQMKNALEKMELSNEDMEKELDRTLELFKQLEFEQEMQNAIDKLKALEEEQQELLDENKEKNSKPEELKEKQDKLNKKAESLKEDLEELKKKNEELENPNELPDQKEQSESLQEEMQNASDQLEKNNRNKSQESQENAKQQMQEMREQMESTMASMQSQQNMENMEDLRALLENLIELSFDQEALMETVKGLKRNDPAFVAANQEQKRIKDNAKMIEDSLFALSKRVMQLEATVNKEINLINNNIEKSIVELASRNPSKAATRQQFIMTSTNNLALILDESLRQMQQQMQSMMQGQQQCKKPGSGKPSMSQLKSMQQSLNQKMKEMLEKMQKGESPNGQTPGQSPGMSKEIAKMAAQQAHIREALKQLQNELDGGENGKAGEGLKKLQELMEQTEEDLVNLNLRQQTLKRQEEILGRLLESEKADREREYDNKRESKEADELTRKIEDIFEEYKKQKEKETELLKTVPPNLNLYYRNKVSEYFNDI